MSAQLAQALKRIAELDYSGRETHDDIDREDLVSFEAAPHQ